MPELDVFAKYVSAVSVTGLLGAVIWFLLKGVFVTGREHAATLAFVTTLQNELASLRGELTKLRDRDDSQQRDLINLRDQLQREQALKAQALDKLNEAQETIISLKSRVQELERQINLSGVVRT